MRRPASWLALVLSVLAGTAFQAAPSLGGAGRRLCSVVMIQIGAAAFNLLGRLAVFFCMARRNSRVPAARQGIEDAAEPQSRPLIGRQRTVNHIGVVERRSALHGHEVTGPLRGHAHVSTRKRTLVLVSRRSLMRAIQALSTSAALPHCVVNRV